MEASLKNKLPQEGTGEAGESLPELSSGCPSYSGEGTELLTKDSTKKEKSTKKLTQQLFHPGLFNRQRSASLSEAPNIAAPSQITQSITCRKPSQVMDPGPATRNTLLSCTVGTNPSLPTRAEKTKRRIPSEEEDVGGDDKRLKPKHSTMPSPVLNIKTSNTAQGSPNAMGRPTNCTEHSPQTDPSQSKIPHEKTDPQHQQVDLSYAEITAMPITSRPVSPQQETISKGPSNSKRKNTKKQFPPIIVESLPNWTQHFAQLRQKLGYTPNGRPVGKGFRFMCMSTDEFRTIQRHLTEATAKNKEVSWHCYAVEDDLPTKVGIKGLPFDTPTDEIKQALNAKGFPTIYVKEIPPRKGSYRPIYYVQLERVEREELARLYAIDELLHMPRIKIEGWKPRGGIVPQCHRCQGFGHASGGCHRPPRCVKCAGDHFTSECKKPSEVPPKCVNCNGEHVACNRRCPVYLKEARKRGVKVSGEYPRQQPQTRHLSDQPGTKLLTNSHNKKHITERQQSVIVIPPANPPTGRDEALPNRRRKRGRRTKNRRSHSPTTVFIPNTEQASNVLQQVKRNSNTNQRARPSILDIETVVDVHPQTRNTSSLQETEATINPNSCQPTRTSRPQTVYDPSSKPQETGMDNLDDLSNYRILHHHQHHEPNKEIPLHHHMPASSVGNPMTIILGILTELLATIAAGGNLQEAAVRGLNILNRVHYG